MQVRKFQRKSVFKPFSESLFPRDPTENAHGVMIGKKKTDKFFCKLCFTHEVFILKFN